MHGIWARPLAEQPGRPACQLHLAGAREPQSSAVPKRAPSALNIWSLSENPRRRGSIPCSRSCSRTRTEARATRR
eukprot:4762020-Pleurochrysis_carterae.AAC.2